MAFLESAVVVYLRELYYPEGFSFPLVIIKGRVALTEVLREAATLVMLLSIGILAGQSFASRFAWFLYTFAIWDIFYYIFLKLLLNWPESLLTNDILFLIPVTWVGPVICPVIVSFSMIGLSLIILNAERKQKTIILSKLTWILLITGSLVLILSFTWDYSKYILSYFSFKEIWTMPQNEDLFEIAQNYVPQSFNWFLFTLGQLTILAGILVLTFHLKTKRTL
jgi:hypothetical protein